MKIDFQNPKFQHPENPFQEKVLEFIQQWNKPQTTLEVQTSGSTGTPKKLQIEKSKMRNSAKLTCDFLHLTPGNTALLCLPIEYISGKMMVARAIERKLHLIILAPCTTPLRHLQEHIDFCAMTPLQVEHSLDQIHLIKNLIIGGAAVQQQLKEKIAEKLQSTTNTTKIFETYGMSETLSHIALKQIYPKPKHYFTLFPGITTALDSRGCLTINAPMLNPETIITNDLVEQHPTDKSRFRYIGRADNIINSAGLKISPEELEALLQKTISHEAIFFGKEDEKLGQKLVLVLETTATPEVQQKLSEIIYPTKNHQPREIIYLPQFPRLPNGKIDRLQLKRMLMQ